MEGTTAGLLVFLIAVTNAEVKPAVAPPNAQYRSIYANRPVQFRIAVRWRLALVQPEPTPSSEHLIIIAGNKPRETLTELRSRFHITQSASMRVFLVHGDISGFDLSRLEGVSVFSTPDIPEDILSSLDSSESLFVSAWIARVQRGAKHRPGDGLNWDHPDFRPPR